MGEKRRNKSGVLKSVAMGVLLFACGLLPWENAMTTDFSQSLVREASVFNGSQTFSGKNTDNLGTDSIDEKHFVIPLGTAFGIKLFTDGIIVASLTEVEVSGSYACPAKDAGVLPGDYLLAINGETLINNTDLAKKIGQSQGESLTLTIKRGNDTFDTAISPVFSGGSFKTGMWVRDSAAGIGTLTFYNPDAGVFAGLGHGICDMDTKGIMEMEHGEPAEITLCGIIPGEIDAPGQLQGFFSNGEAMGDLLQNNDTGIYGTLKEPPTGELLEVAKKSEVQVGDAEILVSLDNSGVKRFSVRIDAVNPDKTQRTRNLVIKVTDENLLALTGGIVQGMSGSPILQNGKLVGAVTHVFLEDPKTGYGIFAETMVEESVIFSMSN